MQFLKLDALSRQLVNGMYEANNLNSFVTVKCDYTYSEVNLYYRFDA